MKLCHSSRRRSPAYLAAWAEGQINGASSSPLSDAGTLPPYLLPSLREELEHMFLERSSFL